MFSVYPSPKRTHKCINVGHVKLFLMYHGITIMKLLEAVSKIDVHILLFWPLCSIVVVLSAHLPRETKMDWQRQKRSQTASTCSAFYEQHKVS